MKPESKKILVLNSGSSSIKFALFDVDANINKVLSGQIDRIGQSDTALSFKDSATGKTGNLLIGKTSPFDFLIDWLKEHVDINSLLGLGHRIVHGMKHTEPELVSKELLEELNRIISYDPDHLPQEIALMETFGKRYPKLPQIACFDTSFHAEMPLIAKLLPLPRRYYDMGIQRYGFHGLSYAYLMEELSRVAGKEKANGKVILAHLGSGASLAAVRNGKSIDTSMGFTPTSGLVMSTRTGDLDPGVAWFLMQSEKLSLDQFSNVVNHQSGMLGISEISSDMQDLLEQQTKDTRAAEAVEVFCYQTKKWIGSFTAVLEGLDTLVFAGGIGENAPEVRRQICNGLQFLGIEFDEERNTKNSSIISTDKSSVTVRVIQTNEELMIAKSVNRVLNSII